MSYQARNARAAKASVGQPAWKITRKIEKAPCLSANPGNNKYPFSTVNVCETWFNVNRCGEFQWAQLYGEPGYTQPGADRGILFANWNDVPPLLLKRLEEQGYEMEWSDEWYVDTESSPCKAWRTSADHMGWEPRCAARDGYIITADSEPQEWIDWAIEGNRTLPGWFDTAELESRGWARVGYARDALMKQLEKDKFETIETRGASSVYTDVWARREAKRKLFLSDARGIYIPRDFAAQIDREALTGVLWEDLEILKAGPDRDLYWDSWEQVLNNAELTLDGIKYRFEQDGDLWYFEQGGEFCEADDKYYIHATPVTGDA